jgi:hypothetical protein
VEHDLFGNLRNAHVKHQCHVGQAEDASLGVSLGAEADDLVPPQGGPDNLPKLSGSRERQEARGSLGRLGPALSGER